MWYDLSSGSFSFTYCAFRNLTKPSSQGIQFNAASYTLSWDNSCLWMSAAVWASVSAGGILPAGKGDP